MDKNLVVTCEWIAFLVWAIHYRRAWETRYKLFTVYLGIIACIELANLLSGAPKGGFMNKIVIHFNVPLQMIFWYWFLLYAKDKKSRMIFLVFSLVYLSFYFAERFNAFVKPVNFDSFSTGIGNLLLIVAIVLTIRNIFRSGNAADYYRTTLFWILTGLIIYYIGSFPYKNFKNYFWSNEAQYARAYFLHYMSQTLNCIMYLLFAFSVRWKIK